MAQLARWCVEQVAERLKDLCVQHGIRPELAFEAELLPPKLREQIGYSPRADLRVQYRRCDIEVRVWLELEVSRADPVANPAKHWVALSATASEPPNHTIALFAISSAVAKGRRQLCEHFVKMLREKGFQFYVEDLLPSVDADIIAKLNVKQKTAFQRALEELDPAVRHKLEEDLRELASRVVEKCRERACPQADALAPGI